MSKNQFENVVYELDFARGDRHPGRARVAGDDGGRGSAWPAPSIDRNCTVLYGLPMDDPGRKGAEEARNQLPALLEAAEKGRSTVITRHGRAVAALVPISAYGATPSQQSLIPAAGTGRGLWGRDSRQTIRRLRGEWRR